MFLFNFLFLISLVAGQYASFGMNQERYRDDRIITRLDENSENDDFSPADSNQDSESSTSEEYISFYAIDIPEFVMHVLAGNSQTLESILNEQETIAHINLDKVYELPGISGPVLLMAANGQFSSIVKMLLDKKANPNIANINGFTPLQLATARKSKKIVGLLLERNADINHYDYKAQNTALHIAARRGYEKIARELIERDANTQILNAKIQTPIETACINNRENIVKLLLNKCIQPTTEETIKKLLLLAYKTGSDKTAFMLMDEYPNYTFTLQNIKNIFMTLSFICSQAKIKQGHINLVDYFLKKADENDSLDTLFANAQEQDTPFHIACSKNNPDLVKTFLKHKKIDLTQLNSNHANVVHIATTSGCKEVVELILEEAHNRSENRSANICKILLSCTDNNCDTPFHALCRYTHLQLLETMMMHNAHAYAQSIDDDRINDPMIEKKSIIFITEDETLKNFLKRLKNNPLECYIMNANNDCCSICYEKFQDHQICIQLPCAHIFHETCSQKWEQSFYMNNNFPTCPNCRKLFSREDSTLYVSQESKENS